MANWRIIDLLAEDREAVTQTATLLFEGFKTNWANAWLFQAQMGLIS